MFCPVMDKSKNVSDSSPIQLLKKVFGFIYFQIGQACSPTIMLHTALPKLLLIWTLDYKLSNNRACNCMGFWVGNIIKFFNWLDNCGHYFQLDLNDVMVWKGWKIWRTSARIVHFLSRMKQVRKVSEGEFSSEIFFA